MIASTPPENRNLFHNTLEHYQQIVNLHTAFVVLLARISLLSYLYLHYATHTPEFVPYKVLKPVQNSLLSFVRPFAEKSHKNQILKQALMLW